MRLFCLLSGVGMCFALAAAGRAQDELPAASQRPRPAGARPAAPAANDAEFQQQVSYALGRNFAQNLQDNEIELDLDALVAGISDALHGAKPKWTDEQLQPTMMRFSQQMQQKAMARITRMAAKNKQEADAFFAQNAKREGVQTTPSGLQYRVLKESDGPSPTMNDTIRCNYRGTLLNGTEFDSSLRRGQPAEFTIAPGLIAGWIEALQKMHVGEKWQLFVPPSLAYEMDPPGAPIEPNSALIFEIELLDILPK